MTDTQRTACDLTRRGLLSPDEAAPIIEIVEDGTIFDDDGVFTLELMAGLHPCLDTPSEDTRKIAHISLRLPTI